MGRIAGVLDLVSPGDEQREDLRSETFGTLEQPFECRPQAQVPADCPERDGTDRRALRVLLEGRQRTVFMLCHYGDCTPREVSAMIGLNESTVRVHLFRAARKLRALLGGQP